MGWLTLFYQLIFCLQLLLLYSQTFAKLCSQDQSSALLHFKQHFSFNNNRSPSICDEHKVQSFPKMNSWKEDGDCCSWDGVTCDTETGHVIGLDLSCSWLHGKIPSNSTLFLLSHMQSLSLCYNDFNYSEISPGFGRFPDLIVLRLSSSNFSGQLPSDISYLSKLVVLDFSGNSQVILEHLALEGMVRNLSKLEAVFLDDVNMSTTRPASFTNLSSSLTDLSLIDCRLVGHFPDSILRLPNLRTLRLQSNPNLTGFFPKVNWSSPIEILSVPFTNFSGQLPNSISNLMSLRFHGSIPVLPHHLRRFLISNNNMTGEITHLICNMSSIAILDLYNNSLSGTIPECLGNFNNSLKVLDLQKNRIYGNIPDSFAKGNHLRELSINDNWLEGAVPPSLENCTRLEVLNIGNNIKDIFPYWLRSLPKLQWSFAHKVF
ncbi:receptor-like protein 6 [Mangifera indica]|uniref:receptor-like protein 6 n=1 Tax=Mangifera indica TaxID=29780 RepID=UPI001CF9F70D|nr:receptor-like protein 6 [Mangifera indica]